MKKTELQDSEELSIEEMKSVNGGLIAVAWWTILFSAVSNFQDIREGLSDGFNNRSPRH